jgi:hypothetical protein
MSNSSLKHVRFTCALIIVFCMVLVCLSGCSSEKPAEAADNNAPDLVKIADNLYETTYTTDFDWGDTTTPDMSGFSCSAVQNGQYRGRNYDWTYADTDLCVVHTTVTENRPHASVGVADMSFLLNDDGSLNYPKLPFVTVDGINDAGVCIQVNVMPYGENGEISHTEAIDDDLAGARVVRYVLDYADSVENALAFLKDKDIHSEMGTAEELHWMISGPASKADSTIKTVVVEVFPDGLHITEKFVDDKPIMTNLNVSNFDGTPDTVGIGLGYERWQILDENYNQANSVMGTFDLMEKVYFSKMYDLYGDRFWYSEYNGVDLTKYYDVETLKSMLGEDTYNYYMDNYGGVYYTSALWDGEKTINGDISKTGILAPSVEKVAELYNAQNKENGSLWITIHTSVYDLENLTLDIQVRESQDHLHFTID